MIVAAGTSEICRAGFRTGETEVAVFRQHFFFFGKFQFSSLKKLIR